MFLLGLDLGILVQVWCSIVSIPDLCPFSYFDKEERAGCFVLTVFLVSCGCLFSVVLTQLLWVGLLCVIVVFPDPTHFLSKLDNFSSGSVLCLFFASITLCSF